MGDELKTKEQFITALEGAQKRIGDLEEKVKDLGTQNEALLEKIAEKETKDKDWFA